jgi:hypothetical protein
VARALHPEDNQAAAAWVKPLLKDLECDCAHQVIVTLEKLVEGMQGSARELVQKEINYFGSNLARLKYQEGQKRGEPLGSGAIESTCRQYQCRLKRPGQFWSREGDEALICWKHSGATGAGTSSFLIPLYRTCLEIEMRPPKASKLR